MLDWYRKLVKERKIAIVVVPAQLVVLRLQDGFFTLGESYTNYIVMKDLMWALAEKEMIAGNFFLIIELWNI